jgi:monoamine oxidase
MALNSEREIVIIGAGAAGLIAADALFRAGKKCLILEARARIGGRIQTVTHGNSFPVELGAEFIHGRPRVTWELLKRFRIKAVPVSSARWRPSQGGFKRDLDSWKKLSQALSQLKVQKKDRSFAQALAEMKIPAQIKEAAERFVSSYHASDIHKISANDLAFQQEAAGESGMEGYRLPKGYGALLENLAASFPSQAIQLNQTALQVRWSRGQAEVLTQKSRFKARRVLVTVPLGVLKSPGALVFRPALKAKETALKKLEMGFAARVSFVFHQPFWRNASPENLSGFFQIEEADIPIWWTGLLKDSPALTGWVGGLRALSIESRNWLIQRGLESLSRVFGLDTKSLKSKLIKAYFHDWSLDPFSRGAYSYCGVGGMSSRKELARPVEKTLFFAGEATDISGEASTVAGAFYSGLRAAEEILKV